MSGIEKLENLGPASVVICIVVMSSGQRLRAELDRVLRRLRG